MKTTRKTKSAAKVDPIAKVVAEILQLKSEINERFVAVAYRVKFLRTQQGLSVAVIGPLIKETSARVREYLHIAEAIERGTMSESEAIAVGLCKAAILAPRIGFSPRHRELLSAAPSMSVLQVRAAVTRDKRTVAKNFRFDAYEDVEFENAMRDAGGYIGRRKGGVTREQALMNLVRTGRNTILAERRAQQSKRLKNNGMNNGLMFR